MPEDVRPKRRRRAAGGELLTPGKVTPLTLENLYGRTSATKRVRELIEALDNDLGGALTAAQRQLATRAALMGAILEDAEAAWLTDGKIVVADYVAVANAQKRILQTLGLRRV